MKNNLNAREWDFLLKIVSEYIKLAEPISSRHLSKLSKVNLSAATIRNTMWSLTDKKLLTQPHASAGRVPTDHAYRIYVDHITDNLVSEKSTMSRKLRQFNDSMGIEELLKECLSVLADGTKYASLATMPDLACLKLKSIEFFKLSGNRVLSVLITDAGLVKTKTLLSRREQLSQQFLRELSDNLTSIYEGKPVFELQEKLLQTLSEKNFNLDPEMFAHAAWLSKKALDWENLDSIIFCGRIHVIEWPELTSKQEINKVYQEIEEGKHLAKALDNDYGLNKAYYKIGNEIQSKSLTGCSLVAANYGINQEKIGSIGVIGPKRMNYKKIAMLVEDLSSLISHKFKNDS